MAHAAVGAPHAAGGTRLATSRAIRLAIALTTALAAALAAAGMAGCATAPAPQLQTLKTTPVECRTGEVTAPALAYDCVRLGGQYLGADARADLTAWLPLGQAGDPVAQTRLGHIYEHGLAGAAPDYVAAAHWYRLAVRAEFQPAIVRYAGLVDRGLGVRRDPDAARALLRRASLGQDWAPPPPRLFLVQPSRVLADQPLDSGVLHARVPRRALQAGLVGRALAADERLRKLVVNGGSVALDAEGFFTLGEAQLRGLDRLTLAATDRRGRTTRLEIELTDTEGGPARADGPPPAGPRTESPPTAAPRIDTLPSAGARVDKATPPAARVEGGASATPGQRHALLIANQDYRHLPRLLTPVNDARALQAVLEERYGFRTRLLVNADRRAVLAALAELRARLGADDELVVFYAGHGEIDEVTERGYWLPVDARRDDRAPWVSSIDVTDALLATPARRVLLIVDSCFAGTINRRALPAAQAETTAWANEPPAGADPSSRRTRLAMASGGLEPVVDGGGGGRHSIYAAALIEVLRGLERPLSARGVADEVQARFMHRAIRLGVAQRPGFAPVRAAGHQGGDFEFLPRPAAP